MTHKKVFVIAEAGVNHNGSLDMAMELVRVAVDAGADAVKFQTFKAERLVTVDAPKAAYQNITTDVEESQLEMLRHLELSADAHRLLMAECNRFGIAFLSTPFDLDSLDFLTKDLKLGVLKLSSGELTNGPLLLRAGRSGCRIILSTGMGTLDEVAAALSVLAFAMTGGTESGKEAFEGAFVSEAGKRALKENVALLQCTSQYPAPLVDANLNAIRTMSDAFGLDVGLSDHTVGHVAAIAAVAMGASIIEKHFTLDQSLPGPDHLASMEPRELAEMIVNVRAAESALGDGIKRPQLSEDNTRTIARKSLVASKPIRAGEVFTEENLCAKRPGDGISPMEFWAIQKQTATRDYRADEKIEKV